MIGPILKTTILLRKGKYQREADLFDLVNLFLIWHE